ncbi:MAG: hypothetical protein MRY79_04000 [Alphaproteobacteria bacterium]|nr:hypothetical protein [Alphaproteobacteria bacterium]
MDGSGFGHIPAQSKISSSGQRSGARQLVQIIQLPQGLQNSALKSAKTIRLEGQFTDVKANGQARIATPQGDIQVQIKGKPLPQTGQKVDIDIPPPRQNSAKTSAPQITQATIKVQPSTTPDPAQARQTVSTPAVKSTSVPQTQNTTSQPAQNAAPLTQASAQGPTQPSANTVPKSVLPSPENLVQHNTKVLSETLVRSSSDILENLRSQALKTQPVERPLQNGNLVRAIQINPGQAQTITLTSQQNLKNLFHTLSKTLGNITTLPKISSSSPPVSLPLNNVLQTPQTQILQTFSLSTEQNIVTPLKALSSQTVQALPPATALAQIITPEQITPIHKFENIISQIRGGKIPASIPTSSHSPGNPITFTPTQNSIVPRIDFTPVLNQKFDAFIVQVNTNVKPSITPLTQGTQQTPPPIPSLTQFGPTVTTQRSAPHIPAQVTGITPEGLPLITAQWPGQKNPISFILQFRANNLPIGSRITLIPVNSALPSLPSITQQTGSAPSSLLERALNLNLSYFNASGWPALEELYNSLLQLSPQSALSLGRSLPTPTNAVSLGPAAMMFIAAVKSGDFGGWLGDKKIDALEKSGKSNILKRLSGEALRGASTATEISSSHEWRPVSIPLFWEGEVHKIMLYTRQENGNEQQESDQENGQTRFIFDLNLSRMGEVQIDGLLKQNRLDLIVRTQHSFSPPMQEIMKQNYDSALTHTDLNGDLNFQGQGQNWIHVLKEEQNLGVDV